MLQERNEVEQLMYRQGPVASSVQNPKAGEYGHPPAILMVNPKYPHNVGAAVRAASCYGVGQVWYTGNRVPIDVPKDIGNGRNHESKTKWRLPREERMRGYADVTLFQNDRPFDQFAKAIPVAIEMRPNAEPLTTFEHPENAVYVFGPEDGSIDQVYLRLCHKFVIIPTKHCLNLSAAINVVLWDRYLKRSANGS